MGKRGPTGGMRWPGHTVGNWLSLGHNPGLAPLCLPSAPSAVHLLHLPICLGFYLRQQMHSSGKSQDLLRTPLPQTSLCTHLVFPMIETVISHVFMSLGDIKTTDSSFQEKRDLCPQYLNKFFFIGSSPGWVGHLSPYLYLTLPECPWPAVFPRKCISQFPCPWVSM